MLKTAELAFMPDFSRPRLLGIFAFLQGNPSGRLSAWIWVEWRSLQAQCETLDWPHHPSNCWSYARNFHFREVPIAVHETSRPRPQQRYCHSSPTQTTFHSSRIYQECFNSDSPSYIANEAFHPLSCNFHFSTDIRQAPTLLQVPPSYWIQNHQSKLQEIQGDSSPKKS